MNNAREDETLNHDTTSSRLKPRLTFNAMPNLGFEIAADPMQSDFSHTIDIEMINVLKNDLSGFKHLNLFD